MANSSRIPWLAAVVSWLALCAAAGAQESVRVDSVRLSSGKLVVIAARQEVVLDGTFHGPGGSRVEFDEGVARSLHKDGKTLSVRGVEVVGDKILFDVEAGKGDAVALDDGHYAIQGSTQPPADPEPQPRPQSFEVDGGAIVGMTIGGSV